MDLDTALRIADGKLRDYVLRHREPAPPISSAYSGVPPARPDRGSQQERWIERYQDDLAIERALRSLSDHEYRFVIYHWRDRYSVEEAAARIPVSRAKGYSMRREILRIVAYALGLGRRERETA